MAWALRWSTSKLPHAPDRIRASLAVLAAALIASDPAGAQETVPPTSFPAHEQAAKLHYEKGTAAYALGDFVEAARQYEAAFRLKLDPALLFDAAQAHRRAGNRVRAIELYENLLQVFPTATGHEVAEQHLTALRKSVATEKGLQSESPTAAPPGPLGVDERNGPGGPARPLYRRTWFLATVASLVVGAVVTVAVLSAGAREVRPSWGRVGQ